jgi:hypothetical protein
METYLEKLGTIAMQVFYMVGCKKKTDVGLLAGLLNEGSHILLLVLYVIRLRRLSNIAWSPMSSLERFGPFCS